MIWPSPAPSHPFFSKFSLSILVFMPQVILSLHFMLVAFFQVMNIKRESREGVREADGFLF